MVAALFKDPRTPTNILLLKAATIFLCRKFLEVCQEKDWIVIALKIMSDHVHLLISVPPNVAAHEVVKAIKGRSSRYLRC